MAIQTDKNLYQLVVNEIIKRGGFDTSSIYKDQSSKSQVLSSIASDTSRIDNIALSDTLNAIRASLQENMTALIISGLVVTAYSDTQVKITSGSGSVHGKVFNIDVDTTLTVPFDVANVLYVTLSEDGLKLDTNESSTTLSIAKIVIPQVGTTAVVADKMNIESPWDAYIINLRPVTLYEDGNGMLEDNSVAFFRDNIGLILADNLIGNIRLSENLKVTNTQGTVEIDSKALNIYDENENLLAQYNKDGSYLYNDSGQELARFTSSEARIGGMKLTSSTIESTNFVTGDNGSGFQINYEGDAEFNNIKVRGTLASSVLEYTSVSSVGGKLLVSPSSALAVDMTALDASTLQVNDSVFAVGDIIRIKDGADDEYLEITDISSAPIYVVTRDLAEQYTADNNPPWTAGVGVVGMGNGNSGTLSGFILLDASDTNAPFIDIVSRNSETYNDYDTKVRLGNLAGIVDADFSDGISGYGLYAENVYLKGELFAPTIKSALSGARIEMTGDRFLVYDDSESVIFEIDMATESGSYYAGDVIIGDYSNDKGIMWDSSLSTFNIRGNLNMSDASSGTLNASYLGAGTIGANEIILGAGGSFVSNNYIAGSTGFILNEYGLQVYDGTIQGNIVAVGAGNLDDAFDATSESDKYTVYSDLSDGTLSNVVLASSPGSSVPHNNPTLQLGIDGVNLGDGRDGGLVVTGGTTTINDTYTYVDSSSASGQKDLNVPSITGFEPGDMILIYDKSTTGGTYELHTIDTIDSGGTTLTLEDNLANTWGISTNNVVIRVPQYTSIWVSSTGILTAGTINNILCFVCKGDVQVDTGGSIHMDYLGWAGGEGGQGMPDNGDNGVGPGGGKGSVGSTNWAGTMESGGGGGGGHENAGTTGETSPASGSTPGGAGGVAYDDNTMSVMRAGSGGGGSGTMYQTRYGHSGGNGGGVIYFKSYSVSIAGTGRISTNGAVGASETARTATGGGGGGAGGTVYIVTGKITAGGNLITSRQGNGGTSYTGLADGGAGSVGVVRIDAVDITGTPANPTPNTSNASAYYTSGTYLSTVVDTSSYVALSTLYWSEYNLDSGDQVYVQIRTGDTNPVDGTWSAWGDIYSSPTGSTLTDTIADYYQFRITFNGSTTNTPYLDRVGTDYLIKTVFDGDTFTCKNSTKLGGEFIEEGYASTDGSGDATISLTKAFTSDDIRVIVTGGESGATYAYTDTRSKTGFDIHGANTKAYCWMCMGS